MNYCLLIVSLFALIACEKGFETKPFQLPDTKQNQQETGRWYSNSQIEQGKVLFRQNCAACHGQNAEATAEWKTPNAAGQYPPPPLNGSAHAWHHPLSVLRQVILKGGAPYGGQMPAWEGKVSDEEILSMIAFFQSYWDEETYQQWLSIDLSSRE